jgi:glycosyltransferase involved in cell wall biosynthesis
MPKAILFISIMDFNNKGIQVLRLTPEYFAKYGWTVHYIVARDESQNGSYYYQEKIDPEGAKVYRRRMPMCNVCERINNHTAKNIYSKLRGFAAIIKLSILGLRIMKKEKIDVLYGAGPHGVLIAHLMHFFYRKAYIVSRFYGTFLSEKIQKRNLFGVALNIDELIAFALPCNLMIVTDDGTKGRLAVRFANFKNLKRLKFWPNGVDSINIEAFSPHLSEGCTICRLTQWKRVDRVIECVNLIVNKYHLYSYKHHIIGDGACLSKLKALCFRYGIEKNVIFYGALDHDKALEVMHKCQIYFSTYDISNVGNPLLEAIRGHKVIFTLNNGDTASWIRHYINGFIYELDEKTIDRMAQDVVAVVGDENLRRLIIKNVEKTESEKLWSWKERLEAEYSVIDRLSVKDNQ